MCAIIAGIRKYNSIIKKKENKNDQIVLLTKSNSNNIEVLISRLFLVNVLRQHDDTKQNMKTLKT